MEKREKLTFDEWCISLVGEMGNSKEDLAIKEELKNLVHDEPGDVPRGTNNQAVNATSESEEIFWSDLAKRIKPEGIVLIPIKPSDFKGSYADYIKELEKKTNNLHKYLNVNKDGERAGDKVVEDKVGVTGNQGIHSHIGRFGTSGSTGPKGYNEGGKIPPAKEGTYPPILGKVVPNKLVNCDSAKVKDNLAVWEEWVNRLKGVKCSVIDDAKKDTIVEGFELEMMFDALNSVVFNKKDQISEKNINKIIKALFRKFDITLKD